MPLKDDPRYSGAYNDESADITLTSSDNMLFKVHSYELKTHSSVFKDMLGDPNMKASPIPIDVNSSDLELFLNFMLQYPPPTISVWRTLPTMLDLADKWGIPLVSERVRNGLIKMTERYPWEIFCFASHEGNLELARKALEKMGQDYAHNSMTLSDISAKDVVEPTVPYLVGLLEQLGTNRVSNWNKKTYRHDVNWDFMAKCFSPRV